eukprot:gb/GEZN01010638.1/.p1 GENE.gb/GEZN01010638.1/~~gb/GEZN01010638.1/.p1  ORF type:complete len:367 (-),score=88.49 gb/GEZN01010638.1/:122-1198(-)
MSFLEDIMAERRPNKRKAAADTEEGESRFKTRKQLKQQEEEANEKIKKIKRAEEEEDEVLADIAAAIDEAESSLVTGNGEQDEKDRADAKRKEIEEEDQGLMPPQKVMQKLRGFAQPITLFGETDTDRLERLKLIEEELEDRQHDAEGLQNVFQQILQTDVESEITMASVGEEQEAEENKKQQERQATKSEKYKERPKDSFKDKESYVAFWIKRMLHEWEVELAERPKEERESHQGKLASATQKQTRQYMRPLLKQCKTHTVPADVLKHFEVIVDFALQRQYSKAGERYMILAIGNAPWPMGVTMVGIHERAGRSRIFSSQIAHALNDETQRKYIQGLKRIITFAQKKYATVPSLSIQ